MTWIALLPAVMLVALMLLCIVQAAEIRRLDEMIETLMRGEDPQGKPQR